MNMLNRFSKTRLVRIGKIFSANLNKTCAECFHHAALVTGALLLFSNLHAHADEIEDANKLFKQGHHSQALEKVNSYLAVKPMDAQARFLKGLILTGQAKTAEAVNIFTALTEDYPELPEPYNNLAVLYAGQGQYEKARQALETAIRTHPSYATAHENLGDIYAKMASQAYDRALQLDRNNTSTQTKLAMIQDLFEGGRSKETAGHSAPPSAKTEQVTTATASKAAIPESKPEAVHAATGADTPAGAPEKDDGKKAEEAIKAWASAWSSKDADKYLSFYADDFKTPSGESLADWKAARKERINAPKYIRVDVRILSTKLTNGNHAMVKFRQNYKSSLLNASGNKTVLLVKVGDQWLIQEERAK